MTKRETISPDLTPLIDVLFILLIFFLVTTVFKKEQLALKLNLPKSSAKMIEIEKQDITIELSQNKVAIFGKTVPIEQIETKLKSIKDKQLEIILKIDESTNYKRVVKVLDGLKNNDLNNINLVTNKK